MLSSSFRRVVRASVASSPLSSRSISNKILFKGVPRFVTLDTVRQNLDKFGDVLSVRKVPLKTESRKFSNVLVEFGALDSALAVMDELDETVMFNERIKLEFHMKPSPLPMSGGGFNAFDRSGRDGDGANRHGANNNNNSNNNNNNNNRKRTYNKGGANRNSNRGLVNIVKTEQQHQSEQV